MRYYPVYLDLRGRSCRVFGNGDLAAQKAASLSETGAKVTVIGPKPGAALRELAEKGAIALLERAYHPGDLAGIDLAIDASENDKLSAEIVAEAEATRTWLNVVDRPALCDFIAPALVRRGDLTIAISTAGASPALARRIREDLDRVYGDEYDHALQVFRAIRTRLRSAPAPHRQAVFKRLAASPLCRYLRDGRREDVDRLLADIVGPEVSLAGLDLDFEFSEDE